MSAGKKISRRRLVQAAAAAPLAAAAFMGPWKHRHVYAAASDKPIKIGLTHDASGQFAASGQSERRGSIMAIEEANAKGGVLGRKLEYIWQDTETTPATGSRVAERFITRDEVAFVVGAVQSGVANAISQVCQKYGTVYFNTNSSSTTESGENCHRTKFMWDGNADNFALAIVRAGMDRFGKKWLLLTNDYVWGRDASAATRKTLDRFGGSVVDEIMVPVGTRDFSAILLKAQQIKPDVVAPAVGGDDYKALRQQIIDQGLQEKLIFSGAAVPDWPDAYPLGRGGVFGAFPTTWYHYLDLPGVPEFVQAFKKRWPDAPEPVPGNVFYNTYYAMRELFRAIERAGSTNNIKVIKQLEGLKMPARERMQHFDAWIDPASHHVQQTVYVGTQNAKPRDDTDLFSIVAWAKPEDVRSDTEKSCKLESYGDTPTYEM